MNIDINEKETKLLISFLEELKERYSTDGCNDWDFPADWTLEEKLKMLPDHGQLSPVCNFDVVRELINRLKAALAL